MEQRENHLVEFGAAKQRIYMVTFERLSREPYGSYRVLRDDGGIVFLKELGGWVVTSHPMIEVCLVRPDLSCDRRKDPAMKRYLFGPLAEFAYLLASWPAFADGEAHEFGRSVFRSIFSAEAVKRFQSKLASQLAQGLEKSNTEIEVVGDVAQTTFSEAVMEIFGFPESLKTRFKEIGRSAEQILF